MLPIIIAAKVEINLINLLENVFHLCMHGCNYPAEICLHEQTQIVASAACRVGRQQFYT